MIEVRPSHLYTGVSPWTLYRDTVGEVKGVHTATGRVSETWTLIRTLCRSTRWGPSVRIFGRSSTRGYWGRTLYWDTGTSGGRLCVGPVDSFGTPVQDPDSFSGTPPGPSVYGSGQLAGT